MASVKNSFQILDKMAACSAAERPRPDALEATVTTVTIPGLGASEGMFVLVEDTRLFSSAHTIILLAPPGRFVTIAGDPQEEDGALKDGQGIFARFNHPEDLTVDKSGNVVVVDHHHHVIRLVTKEGAVVSTLTKGFADGPEANVHFNQPMVVVVAANGDIFVVDSRNHTIRVTTPQVAVRTLYGNGQAGFADAQRVDTRFNYPAGLALSTRWTPRRTCWWQIVATTQ